MTRVTHTSQSGIDVGGAACSHTKTDSVDSSCKTSGAAAASHSKTDSPVASISWSHRHSGVSSHSELRGISHHTAFEDSSIWDLAVEPKETAADCMLPSVVVLDQLLSDIPRFTADC